MPDKTSPLGGGLCPQEVTPEGSLGRDQQALLLMTLEDGDFVAFPRDGIFMVRDAAAAPPLHEAQLRAGEHIMRVQSARTPQPLWLVRHTTSVAVSPRQTWRAFWFF